MHRYIIFSILALAAFSSLADAQEQSRVVFLTPAQLAMHEKTIGRVQEYITNLTTIIADFTQVAPDGTLTNGKFYLQRPGHMRWQYNPPTPVLMVADGRELIFYDYELQQVTHLPLDQTLIGFMARERISFDDFVGVRDIEAKDSAVRLTLAERGKPENGELMLEFSDNPLLLRNMVITDANRQTTTVSLNNAQFGTPIDKKLFVFKDPRGNRRRD